MEKKIAAALFSTFLFFALVNAVKADDESFADQFLANPLLILVGIILIDVIFFIYHRVRK